MKCLFCLDGNTESGCVAICDACGEEQDMVAEVRERLEQEYVAEEQERG